MKRDPVRDELLPWKWVSPVLAFHQLVNVVHVHPGWAPSIAVGDVFVVAIPRGEGFEFLISMQAHR